MDRRTKIVSTLGPASTDMKTISGLIEAGVNVFRMNFSHGTHEEHRQRIIYAREAARKLGKDIAILQDLQGPKIRVGELENGVMHLEQGSQLVLTNKETNEAGSGRVFVSYATLPEDVEIGGRILLDDGLLELKVLDTTEHDVITEVMVSGPLKSRKGVNLPHLRASAPALTEKDIIDLEFGLSMEVDVIALSFVRDESDVIDIVQRIRNTGKQISVIAKIEKPEAVRNIDQILEHADGIMVARGDLGIEMPMEMVPSTQKQIILKCRQAAKPVITATQMLESMIENPRPTRAEASDVANAVLDGSDALMLSGETAVGKYPIRVVEAMDLIIREAERQDLHPSLGAESNWLTESLTESISYNAYELADQVDAKAIVCLTSSGKTARAISRHRPNIPIYAFTNHEKVVQVLALTWGTKAFAIPFQRDTDGGVKLVLEILKSKGYVDTGDRVVITAGMPLPARGRTNMILVSQID
ncbi:MAG: pyruvate kinase [Rhodothermales bacterium]